MWALSAHFLQVGEGGGGLSARHALLLRLFFAGGEAESSPRALRDGEQALLRWIWASPGVPVFIGGNGWVRLPGRSPHPRRRRRVGELSMSSKSLCASTHTWLVWHLDHRWGKGWVRINFRHGDESVATPPILVCPHTHTHIRMEWQQNYRHRVRINFRHGDESAGRLPVGVDTDSCTRTGPVTVQR